MKGCGSYIIATRWTSLIGNSPTVITDKDFFLETGTINQCTCHRNILRSYWYISHCPPPHFSSAYITGHSCFHSSKYSVFILSLNLSKKCYFLCIFFPKSLSCHNAIRQSFPDVARYFDAEYPPLSSSSTYSTSSAVHEWAKAAA